MINWNIKYFDFDHLFTYLAVIFKSIYAKRLS